MGNLGFSINFLRDGRTGMQRKSVYSYSFGYIFKQKVLGKVVKTRMSAPKGNKYAQRITYPQRCCRLYLSEQLYGDIVDLCANEYQCSLSDFIVMLILWTAPLYRNDYPDAWRLDNVQPETSQRSGWLIKAQENIGPPIPPK